MSERLETLKTARQRMIEDRDTHAKVLAAPFDRDKAERARNKFIEIQALIDALDRAKGAAADSAGIDHLGAARDGFVRHVLLALARRLIRNERCFCQRRADQYPGDAAGKADRCQG